MSKEYFWSGQTGFVYVAPKAIRKNALFSQQMQNVSCERGDTN